MSLHILGVDVAKLKFNVCLIREDGRLKHRVFANTQVGFSQLSEWLKKNHVAQVHACLEATGLRRSCHYLFEPIIGKPSQPGSH